MAVGDGGTGHVTAGTHGPPAPRRGSGPHVAGLPAKRAPRAWAEGAGKRPWAEPAAAALTAENNLRPENGLRSW